MCTYADNIDARTMCEVCGSDRPKTSASSSAVADLVALGFTAERAKLALDLNVGSLLLDPEEFAVAAESRSCNQLASHQP